MVVANKAFSDGNFASLIAFDPHEIFVVQVEFVIVAQIDSEKPALVYCTLKLSDTILVPK